MNGAETLQLVALLFTIVNTLVIVPIWRQLSELKKGQDELFRRLAETREGYVTVVRCDRCHDEMGEQIKGLRHAGDNCAQRLVSLETRMEKIEEAKG